MKNILVKIVCAALLSVTLLFGYAEASYEKGAEARAGGDYAEALHQWLVASDDPRCMTAIGVMYDYGEGLPKDDIKAAEWYTKAADKGEYRAIAQLANFSLTGAGGVERNPAEWRAKLEAIEGKDSYADYILASFYMEGHGGGKELDKARGLLQSLIDKGYTQFEAPLRQVEEHLADQKAGVADVETLIAEMVADPASFDRRYLDKRLTLRGSVVSMTRPNAQGYVARLGSDKPAATPQDSILAVFYEPASTGPLASMKPGDAVKFSGVYLGRQPFPLEEGAFTLFGAALADPVSADTRP